MLFDKKSEDMFSDEKSKSLELLVYCNINH